MKFGCHLPVYGPAATRHTLLGFARQMEALGYDSLWASDHVVIPHSIAPRYPYSATGAFPLSPATNFLEPLTALALVAGATERISLGTTVLVLPHRHPVLAAKMLATLDHLAAGRVIVGAGVGWMREEIEIFGVPYARRGAWSDEAIRVMRACWAGERVEHRGEFWSFPPFASLPRPVRGKVPIWIGGHTPRALRRVAELGDGWHAAFPSAEKMKAGVGDLEAACRTAGRDMKSLTLSARLGLPAKQEAGALVGEIKALAGLGVSHVILESRARDLADMTSIYEKFAQDVRSKL
jgi:probable F420-dependent oxidoreductase